MHDVEFVEFIDMIKRYLCDNLVLVNFGFVKSSKKSATFEQKCRQICKRDEAHSGQCFRKSVQELKLGFV